MLENTKTSELMEIQPTIVRFTKMLASVLKIDAEVVDSNLVRIAGTGPYDHSFGKKLNTNSRLFRYIIETKEDKILMKSQADPLFESDDSNEGSSFDSNTYSHNDAVNGYQEMAFLGVPILLEERCIGVISLVAFSEESQQLIKNNVTTFSDYIKHIAQLVISKLVENKSQPNTLQAVFLNLIDNMDQGVLVLDENDYVKYGNQPALNNLNLTQKDLATTRINIRALSYCKNNIDNQQQHIISFGKREELLVGRFSNCDSHKLFLMSFHQPHNPTITSESNAVLANMVGESKAMLNVKSFISRIAPSPSSVLINGESGTGKEVIANAIHKLSPRAKNPFIALNCAAIPNELLESELFGYIKGAFTGASSKGKVGLIQAANTGTLFLDEIGDMSMQLQAKLLRVLETREVMPVGSNKALPVDIRIISATNRNFSELIAKNEFREDLYYRLNVVPLHLPPLKERSDDVQLLINYFLVIHTEKLGATYPGITHQAMDSLTHYHWPGNVRELSNLVEYLINILPDGDTIDTDLLPPHFQKNIQENSIKAKTFVDGSVDCTLVKEGAGMSLEHIEKIRIEEAISRLSNRKLVAKELDIGIATLYRKIKKYGLKG